MNQVNNQEKSIYLLGAVTALIALGGIMLDVVIGTITGGNLSALPQTAIERFEQLHTSPMFGLYNLDLLNIINQIIVLPSYFALYSAHRANGKAYAELAFIIFLAGTIIFVATNTALPMLELSNKYFIASEGQKTLLAAAGEAMLARGAHGSLGVFIGFMLPTLASVMMSVVMLNGKVFGKITSWLGIIGNSLLLVYIILVTFIPAAKDIATALAMPGGLMAMAWMILFTIVLFKLGKHSPPNQQDSANEK
ncbi:MAG: hypothetical protein ABL895_08170 [Cyclobacteriaceae bacterium]